MDLLQRGWRVVDDGKGAIPRVEVWRKDADTFWVEVELWASGRVRGRLCCGSDKVEGAMSFDDLGDVEKALEFLELLLEDAEDALSA